MHNTGFKKKAIFSLLSAIVSANGSAIFQPRYNPSHFDSSNMINPKISEAKYPMRNKKNELLKQESISVQSEDSGNDSDYVSEEEPLETEKSVVKEQIEEDQGFFDSDSIEKSLVKESPIIEKCQILEQKPIPAIIDKNPANSSIQEDSYRSEPGTIVEKNPYNSIIEEDKDNPFSIYPLVEKSDTLSYKAPSKGIETLFKTLVSFTVPLISICLNTQNGDYLSNPVFVVTAAMLSLTILSHFFGFIRKFRSILYPTFTTFMIVQTVFVHTSLLNNFIKSYINTHKTIDPAFCTNPLYVITSWVAIFLLTAYSTSKAVSASGNFKKHVLQPLPSMGLALYYTNMLGNIIADYFKGFSVETWSDNKIWTYACVPAYNYMKTKFFDFVNVVAKENLPEWMLDATFWTYYAPIIMLFGIVYFLINFTESFVWSVGCFEPSVKSNSRKVKKPVTSASRLPHTLSQPTSKRNPTNKKSNINRKLSGKLPNENDEIPNFSDLLTLEEGNMMKCPS